MSAFIPATPVSAPRSCSHAHSRTVTCSAQGPKSSRSPSRRLMLAAAVAAAGASLAVSSVQALPSMSDLKSDIPDMASMRNFSSSSSGGPVAKNQAPGIEEMTDRELMNMDKLNEKIAARKAAKKVEEEKAKAAAEAAEAAAANEASSAVAVAAPAADVVAVQVEAVSDPEVEAAAPVAPAVVEEHS